MVVFVSPSRTGKTRRISSLILKGNWRTSWRNSNQTLESREDPKSVHENGTADAKRVRFSDKDTMIPLEDEPPTMKEIRRNWWNNDDYTRFEKDRVLTSFGWVSSYGWVSSRKMGSTSLDDSEHSVRGLESLTDTRLCRRQIGEKKGLTKALKAEEERQKLEGSFPDLEQFRAISLKHSKAGRERALAMGHDDAKSCRPKKGPIGALSMSPLTRLRRKSHSSDGGLAKRASIC